MPYILGPPPIGRLGSSVPTVWEWDHDCSGRQYRQYRSLVFLVLFIDKYKYMYIGAFWLLVPVISFVCILEKIYGFKQNTYSNNLTGFNGGNQCLQIFFLILMKTKIRGLDLKLHLLSLKYSVLLNVTTCTYQIQIIVTLLQLVPVHVRVAEGQET